MEETGELERVRGSLNCIVFLNCIHTFFFFFFVERQPPSISSALFLCFHLQIYISTVTCWEKSIAKFLPFKARKEKKGRNLMGFFSLSHSNIEQHGIKFCPRKIISSGHWGERKKNVLNRVNPYLWASM